MKLLIVNNASSGFGEGAVFDYLRMVLEDGDEATVRCISTDVPTSELVHDADQFDAVVVSGGDGTATSVAYALAGTGTPVLPFPAGTANLLANNLLLPFEPHSLARTTRALQCMDFDLGEIEAAGRKIGFGIMAGAGYDAVIMHAAKPTKKLLGPIAYFQAAVTNTTPTKSRIELTVDGRKIVSEGLCVLLVNFSRIQFEIPVTHDTSARDGEFDVVVFKAENAFGLIPAVIDAIRDRDGEHPNRTDSMEVYRGREISVYADPPLQIEYDGEVPGITTPFTARVLHHAAHFIMSEEGLRTFS